MLIKQNSNVVTLRLIRQYIDDRQKYLEKMWEETHDDPKQFEEHCIFIGRLHELEEFNKWFKEIHEVNENK